MTWTSDPPGYSYDEPKATTSLKRGASLPIAIRFDEARFEWAIEEIEVIVLPASAAPPDPHAVITGTPPIESPAALAETLDSPSSQQDKAGAPTPVRSFRQSNLDQPREVSFEFDGRDKDGKALAPGIYPVGIRLVLLGEGLCGGGGDIESGPYAGFVRESRAITLEPIEIVP